MGARMMPLLKAWAEMDLPQLAALGGKKPAELITLLLLPAACQRACPALQLFYHFN